jgi:hypothetical protein
MANRKIEVRLSMNYQVLVQDDAGQPFNSRINENFNNSGTSTSVASKQDQDATTLTIAAGGNKTIDVSNLGTLDYAFLKSDAPMTVQFGADAAIPVNSIFVKDGGFPVGITAVKVSNPGTSELHLTYSFTGH